MVPLVRNPKRVFEFLALIHLIGLAVALSPLSFPYTGYESASPAPQRVYIFQVQRQFFFNEKNVSNGKNEQKRYYNDSGLWLLNMDRNSPSALLNEIPALVEAKQMSADCYKNLTCGLPIYSPRWLAMCPGSLWLPTGGFPTLSPNTQLILKEKQKVGFDVYRLKLDFTGPSHLGMVVCPFQNITLINWSMDAEILSTGYHEDRPYYFIYIGRGYRRVSEVWKLSIDLKVPPNWNDLDDVMEVIAIGQYFNDVPYGQLLNDILDKKPSWSHATIWSSWYNRHVF